MSQSNKEKQLLSRRDTLKALAAAGGAVALSMLPNGWEKPAVKIGTLPAFAQVSPVYTITCGAAGADQPPGQVNRDGVIINIQATVSPIPPQGTGVQDAITTDDPNHPSLRESVATTNASGVADFANFDLANLSPWLAFGTLITLTFTFSDQATFGTASCSTTLTVIRAPE
jgi:hypothetical protein